MLVRLKCFTLSSAYPGGLSGMAFQPGKVQVCHLPVNHLSKIKVRYLSYRNLVVLCDSYFLILNPNQCEGHHDCLILFLPGATPLSPQLPSHPLLSYTSSSAVHAHKAIKWLEEEPFPPHATPSFPSYRATKQMPCPTRPTSCRALGMLTLYGTMRVYEWGPEHGDKVLLVHGDTTPVPMLGPIARALVQAGRRVMLVGKSIPVSSFTLSSELSPPAPFFSLAKNEEADSTHLVDSWGKGYTDTPLGVPHDIRLYSMQLLFATASSLISWTGASSGGFSIIAFSLGGAETIYFASHFPYLINSIILLAPAGLLRRMPEGYDSIFFRYPFLVPFTYLRKLVGNILGVDQSKLPVAVTRTHGENSHSPGGPPQSKALESEALDVPAIVQWQFDNHQEFVHTFANTIKYGPLMHQHQAWDSVCRIIQGQSSSLPSSDQPCKLYNSKILVLLRDADGVVVPGETS